MRLEEGIVVRGMVVRVTKTEGEKCQTCTGEKTGGIAQENLTEAYLFAGGERTRAQWFHLTHMEHGMHP